MSYRHWIFYNQDVVYNNIEHCSRIQTLKLSNEKPFDHLTKFLPLIDLYVNLRRLDLKYPTVEHLQLLPAFVPNLSQLYIVLDNVKPVPITWLSSLRQLEKCSIEGK